MKDHLVGDLNQRSKSLKHTAAASSIDQSTRH